MDNEVMELIDQLYTMVSEAWGVPLGNEKCIVERDQVLEILDEIKTAMPVELSEAKRLVSARDEFINNAKREAEGIRNQAEERARALVDDQEIVRIAKARSNEMLASTQAKADALRRASSQFCDEALRRTEEAISAACSRRTLRSRTLPAARLRPPLPLQPDSRRSASRARKPPRRKPTDLLFLHIRTAAGMSGGGGAFCRNFSPPGALWALPAGTFSRFGGTSCAAVFLFSAGNANACGRKNHSRLDRIVGNCKKKAGISPCNFSILPL